MKKFYAFAAAALMAVAANAQTLYICGAGDGLDWTPETPETVPMVDGKYVMEVTNLTQFKLSTEFGDWDTFNAAALGCTYGSEPGVEVALELGYADNIVAPWKGDYTITVSGDMSTIVLTTTTPKPDENALPEIYFRGDMNGWNAEAEWKWEALTATQFRFTCAEGQAILVGEGFKIADADWNTYNFGAGEDPTILLDFENQIFAGGSSANLSLEEEFNGVAWFHMVEGEEGMEYYLELSNDKSFTPEWYDDSAVEEVAVEEGEAVYYTLQGVKVANPANGIYVVVKGGKAVKAVVK